MLIAGKYLSKFFSKTGKVVINISMFLALKFIPSKLYVARAEKQIKVDCP